MSMSYGDLFVPDVVSNCCGARVYYYDLCEDCKEHCTPTTEEEYYGEEEIANL